MASWMFTVVEDMGKVKLSHRTKSRALSPSPSRRLFNRLGFLLFLFLVIVKILHGAIEFCDDEEEKSGGEHEPAEEPEVGGALELDLASDEILAGDRGPLGGGFGFGGETELLPPRIEPGLFGVETIKEARQGRGLTQHGTVDHEDRTLIPRGGQFFIRAGAPDPQPITIDKAVVIRVAPGVEDGRGDFLAC